jgi:hypothetical protein
MILFSKAWKLYPEGRALLLSRVSSSEDFWARPEAADYAREAVIPGSATRSIDPWYGLGLTPSVGAGPNPKLTSVPARLLSAAVERKTLDSLASEVEATVRRLPNWEGGRALLGVVLIRQGRTVEGRQLLEKLISAPVSTPPYFALQFVGEELKDDPALAPLATLVFERALKSDNAATYGAVSFQGSATRHLARLYHADGRRANARATVRQALDFYEAVPNINGLSLVALRKLAGINAVGDLFLEIGDPADALLAFSKVLAASWRWRGQQDNHIRATTSRLISLRLGPASNGLCTGSTRRRSLPRSRL